MTDAIRATGHVTTLENIQVISPVKNSPCFGRKRLFERQRHAPSELGKGDFDVERLGACHVTTLLMRIATSFLRHRDARQEARAASGIMSPLRRFFQHRSTIHRHVQ